MKKTILTIILILTVAHAYAQTSPETYMNQLPAAPASVCNVQPAEKASYIKSLRSLKSKMEKDLLQRREESQLYIDANRDKIAAGVIPQPGSVEKMTGKSSRLTKQERKARAEQMMRQYGVSTDEIKKLKSMSKEEKAAWGTAYSGSVADKTKTDRPFSEQTRAIHDMQLEQKALMEKIDGRITGILSRFKSLDQNAAATKAKELDPLQRQLTGMGGIVTNKEQSDRMDQLAAKLKDAQKRYCETYSTQYITLLDEHLAAVKASLPDYQRMEEIIARTQMGLEKPIDANAGLLGIEALNDYTAMLLKVFKFDLPFEY